MGNDGIDHPEPYQVEALALLAEECGEVVQIVGKCLRHGMESYNPDLEPVDADDEYPPTNTQLLEKEVGDLLAAIEIAVSEKLLSQEHLDENRKDKLKRVGQWLHYCEAPKPAPSNKHFFEANTRKALELMRDFYMAFQKPEWAEGDTAESIGTDVRVFLDQAAADGWDEASIPEEF